MKFLQNPKVTSSPLKQKQQFLLSKGLTNEEIKRAFELTSLPSSLDNNQFDLTTTVNIPPPNQVYPHYLSYQPTLFYKVKEFFNVTALIGTTVYCIYWFYKVNIIYENNLFITYEFFKYFQSWKIQIY